MSRDAVRRKRSLWALKQVVKVFLSEMFGKSQLQEHTIWLGWNRLWLISLKIICLTQNHYWMKIVSVRWIINPSSSGFLFRASSEWSRSPFYLLRISLLILALLWRTDATKGIFEGVHVIVVQMLRSIKQSYQNCSHGDFADVVWMNARFYLQPRQETTDTNESTAFTNAKHNHWCPTCSLSQSWHWSNVPKDLTD